MLWSTDDPHPSSRASLDLGACYLRSRPPACLRVPYRSASRGWSAAVRSGLGRCPAAADLDGVPQGPSRVSWGKVRRRAGIVDDELTQTRPWTSTSMNTFDCTNSKHCRPIRHNTHEQRTYFITFFINSVLHGYVGPLHVVSSATLANQNRYDKPTSCITL